MATSATQPDEGIIYDTFTDQPPSIETRVRALVLLGRVEEAVTLMERPGSKAAKAADLLHSLGKMALDEEDPRSTYDGVEAD